MLMIAEKALHASGEVFAQEIVDAARVPGVTPVLAEREEGTPTAAFLTSRLRDSTAARLGSNGLAIGRELSASGRGMLLGNRITRGAAPTVFIRPISPSPAVTMRWA